MRPADLDQRLTVETPDVVAEAPSRARRCSSSASISGPSSSRALPRHPGRRCRRAHGDPHDPGLQAWFVRTRGAVGFRIVGLREARRELLAALRAGRSVGLVGDRDLTGGGTLVPALRGTGDAPARAGAAGHRAGAPTYVVGVRRAGAGRYVGRLDPVAVPAEGRRRERVTARRPPIARAFERSSRTPPSSGGPSSSRSGRTSTARGRRR